MTIDLSSTAPVFSGNSEFHRVEQSSRKYPKPSSNQLLNNFSLNEVAQSIYEYLESQNQECCGSSSPESKNQACDKSKACCNTNGNPSSATAVALQFPDRLLVDSGHISQLLNEQLEKIYSLKNTDNKTNYSPPRLYILGDTSYSPCCVDVVAAQHIKAKTIVHFGTACLNPVRGAHVIYTFGKEKLACGTDNLEKFIRHNYTQNTEIEKAVLIYDPEYEYELRDFVETRFHNDNSSNFPEIIDTKLTIPNDSSVIVPSIVKSTPSNSEINTSDTLLQIPGKTILSKTPIQADDFLDSGSIFYVTHGNPSPSILLNLTTIANSVYIIDGTEPLPESSSSPTTETDEEKMMKQFSTLVKTPITKLQHRYRSMNVARTAGTIGILINTLSFRDVTTAIQRLQKWITDAGKKYYTFVVGKPNVPKLANFDVVDIWVILGCPRGGILMDTNGGLDPEYYKPIITPYELKMALQPMPTWTGKWAIQFENVINNMKNLGLQDDDGEDVDEENNSKNSDDSLDEDESEPPEFDPVTGKFVSTSRPLRTRRITHLEVQQDDEDHDHNHAKNNGNNNTVEKLSDAEINEQNSKGLVVRHSSHLVIRNTVSTAADHLYNKLTWTGLGSDFNNGYDNDDDDEDKNVGNKKQEKRYATVERGRGGIARNYGLVDEKSVK